MRTWVYFHKNENDDVLYVGMSGDPLSRTTQHSKTSEWFNLVRSIDVVQYENRDDAEKAEAKAIFEINPPFNKVLIIDGKVIRASWVEQRRNKYFSIRDDLVRKIKFIGSKEFSRIVNCSEYTILRIVLNEKSVPTRETLRKINQHFDFGN